jgi:hypothetical protein
MQKEHLAGMEYAQSAIKMILMLNTLTQQMHDSISQSNN